MSVEVAKMNRLFFLFLMFVCIAAATKCIIQEKKDDPEIQVIHLEDGSKESDEPEIVALDFANRRKREASTINLINKPVCKTNEDCNPEEVCVGYLRCVKSESVVEDPRKLSKIQ